MLDEVLFGCGRPDLSSSTALLRAVERERGALDVAAVGYGDEDIFLDDKILDRELALRLNYLGATGIGKLFFYFVELAGDQLQQLFFVGENFLEARDKSEGLLVLGFYLVALERSQAPEREIEYRLRLQLREAELLHQAGARGFGILRSANQLDDRVEIL